MNKRNHWHKTGEESCSLKGEQRKYHACIHRRKNGNTDSREKRIGV
nr:hypothetical protein [uncultured Blautia sp.]